MPSIVNFFHLGSQVVKVLTLDPSEERVFVIQRSFRFKEKEESIDHIFFFFISMGGSCYCSREALGVVWFLCR